MKFKFTLLVGAMLLGASVLLAQAQFPGSEIAQATPPPLPTDQSMGVPTMGPTAGTGPMTEKEVTTELKKKDATDQLLSDLKTRGVSFEVDPEIEKRLRKAKATDDIIKAITAAGPKERAAAAAKAPAAASGGLALSKEEGLAYNAIQSELDPDKIISLANAYAQKYPGSAALSYVVSMEAMAYEDKGDVEKIVAYSQRSLELKKDNFMALMMLAYAIPQPQFINKHGADEEKLLGQADAYCQQAFLLIDELKKAPTESDADFVKRKAGYTASLHADLGMIHLDRAQQSLMGMDMDELAKAEKEYKLSVTLTDRPDPADYFRLGDTYRLEGKLDDSIAAFTKASELGKGAVKQFAEQQVAALKAAKAQAGAAAKP